MSVIHFILSVSLLFQQAPASDQQGLENTKVNQVSFSQRFADFLKLYKKDVAVINCKLPEFELKEYNDYFQNRLSCGDTLPVFQSSPSGISCLGKVLPSFEFAYTRPRQDSELGSFFGIPVDVYISNGVEQTNLISAIISIEKSAAFSKVCISNNLVFEGLSFPIMVKIPKQFADAEKITMPEKQLGMSIMGKLVSNLGSTRRPQVSGFRRFVFGNSASKPKKVILRSNGRPLDIFRRGEKIDTTEADFFASDQTLQEITVGLGNHRKPLNRCLKISDDPFTVSC